MMNGYDYQEEIDDYEDLGPDDDSPLETSLSTRSNAERGRESEGTSSDDVIRKIREWRKKMGIDEPESDPDPAMWKSVIPNNIDTRSEKTVRPKRFQSRAEDAQMPPPKWLIQDLIPEDADVALY